MSTSSRLLQWLEEHGSTRRDFLKRSVVMGASIPAVGSLLAACGGDDDDDDDDDDVVDEVEDEVEPTATEAAEDDEEEEDEEEEPTEEDMGEEEPTEAEDEEEPTEAEDEDEEPTEAEDDDAGEASSGGTLILMGHHEIDSLSPDDDGPTVQWVMVTQIHNALVELDPFYTLQPVLADSFEVNEEGTQYTFALHEGVLFHDGEEFTSEDVRYTYEFNMDPDNAMISASNFNSIDNIETPDDYTVVINLSSPNAAFLAITAQSFIVPEHHHGEIGEDAYKSDPMGTGPFMLSEYSAAEFAEVTAFEDHFRGRPNLDAVRENIVPEPSVRAVALETGEADSSVWTLNTEDNIRLEEAGEFKTYITSSVACNHFPLDNRIPQFAEKEVRQALMYALDRDTIVNDLWQGLAIKATANLAPALAFYYEPDVKQYEYDPEMAEQLLDDAGWTLGDDGVREKDGERLEWTISVIAGDQARRPEAEFAQASWNAIGCDVSIEDTTAASDGMRDGTHQMALYNWTYGGGSGEPDASNTLRSDALNNFSHYASEEMDELLDAGLAEPDTDARQAIYSDVQKLVAEDVPFLFVKYWDWFNFFNNRIGNLPDEVLSGSQIYNTAWQMTKESE